MKLRMRAMCALLIVASMFVASLAIAHEPDAEEIALGSLVDAELAFANMAQREGVTAAFVANFADDGVAFQPAPVRVREAWRNRANDTNNAVHMDWKPAQAGVARSHDFGYTTGPFTAWRESAPDRKREGAFFSVWKRDPGGTWKVIVDIGIASAQPVDFAALGAAPRPSFGHRGSIASARARLVALEANTGLTPNDYAKLLADDARLYRNGGSPIALRGAIAREVAEHTRRTLWSPVDARIATSSDMAVTWGRYSETERAANEQRGYYVHLWIRDRSGDWRLAYDVATPEK
ncbi:MAG TPA: nuclear transport factor 2 family protein [Casimicrobiaceae bacterium]|nr:nuclear transport factor 2 family protein [Casimicrobiaceae bacterium]